MSQVSISERPTGYLFEWKEQGIHIGVSQLRRHNDGRLTGEVLITTSAPGYKPHLHQAQFNFSSTRSRNDLKKEMERLFPEGDWMTILEQLCLHVLKKTREGAPLEIIWPSEAITKADYLLEPLLPLNQPAIFYGEGGAGKSLLATLLCIVLTLPWENNHLGLKAPPSSTHVLYLDYEADSSIFGWRLASLLRGLDLPPISIAYRRCALPLPDDLEPILNAAAEIEATLLVIDSLGYASGGNLNEAETAMRFFGALRHFKGTSLLIGHTAKDPDKKVKTPFGSSYYTFSARTIWEVCRYQEAGEDSISVGLFHRKSNYSRLFRPLGFQFKFIGDSIAVEPEEPRTVAAFRERISLRDQIFEALKSGAKTTRELAEELQVSESHIRARLSESKGKLFTPVPDGRTIRWGLLSKALE